MNKSEEWYKRQLKGLLMIVNDGRAAGDIFIGREYIDEKLNLILNGQGVNFHQTIKNILDAKECVDCCKKTNLGDLNNNKCIWCTIK